MKGYKKLGWIVGVFFIFGCGGEPEDITPVDEPFTWDNTHQVSKHNITSPLEAQPEMVTRHETRPELPKTVAPLRGVVWLRKGGSLYIHGKPQLDKLMQANFSLETWINPEQVVRQTLLRVQGLTIEIRAQRFFVKIAGQELMSTGIVADEWYHMALVVKGNQLTLFVNGHLDAQYDVSDGWTRPHGSFTFGGRIENGETFPFVGLIDNLRLALGAIYTRDFYPSQEFEPTDVGFAFDFDGQSGTEITDISGNNNNGRLAGDAQVIAGSI